MPSPFLDFGQKWLQGRKKNYAQLHSDWKAKRDERTPKKNTSLFLANIHMWLKMSTFALKFTDTYTIEGSNPLFRHKFLLFGLKAPKNDDLAITVNDAAPCFES